MKEERHNKAAAIRYKIWFIGGKHSIRVYFDSISSFGTKNGDTIFIEMNNGRIITIKDPSMWSRILDKLHIMGDDIYESNPVLDIQFNVQSLKLSSI